MQLNDPTLFRQQAMINGRWRDASGKETLAVTNPANGETIGTVCSGGFGPTLGGPLAMGYLDSAYVALDTPVWAIVRGKKVPLLVSKMPFVPQRYYRG